MNRTPQYWARPDAGVNPAPPPHRYHGHEIRPGDLVRDGRGWATVLEQRWRAVVTKGVPTQLLDTSRGCVRAFDVLELAQEDLT